MSKIKRTKEEKAILDEYARAAASLFLAAEKMICYEKTLDRLGTKYNKIDFRKIMGLDSIEKIFHDVLTPVVYTGWKHYNLTNEQLIEVYRTVNKFLKTMSPKQMEKELDEAGITLDQLDK